MSSMAPAKSGHPPLAISLVGLVFLIFFLIGIMMQIQTNEALVLGTGDITNVFRPNWNILMQIPDLLQGNLDLMNSIAAFIGWGIEIVYLGFVVGYEELQYAANRSGKSMASIFRYCSWAIVLFNCWCDYNFGTVSPALGVWGHIIFAGMVSFVVGFFATVGIYLIERGWHKA